MVRGMSQPDLFTSLDRDFVVLLGLVWAGLLLVSALALEQEGGMTSLDDIVRCSILLHLGIYFHIMFLYSLRFMVYGLVWYDWDAHYDKDRGRVMS